MSWKYSARRVTHTYLERLFGCWPRVSSFRHGISEPHYSLQKVYGCQAAVLGPVHELIRHQHT